MSNTNQSTALTVKNRIRNFMAALDIKDAEIAAALPSTAHRLRAKMQLQMLLRDKPELLQCVENGTLFNSFLKACMFRLELGTECYIIPYKNVAVFQTDYKGLCKLARRNEEIQDIFGVVVYDCDDFAVTSGEDGVRIAHTMNVNDERYGDPKHVVGAYAVCAWKNGYRKPEYMNKRQIDHIRSKSKAKDDGPWVTDYAEMARKTVIRRLAKFIPQHPDLSEALDLENRADIGAPQFDTDDVIDITGASQPIAMPVTKPKETPKSEAADQPEAKNDQAEPAPEETPQTQEDEDRADLLGKIESLIPAVGIERASAITQEIAKERKLDPDAVREWANPELLALYVALRNEAGKSEPPKEEKKRTRKS